MVVPFLLPLPTEGVTSSDALGFPFDTVGVTSSDTDSNDSRHLTFKFFFCTL